MLEIFVIENWQVKNIDHISTIIEEKKIFLLMKILQEKQFLETKIREQLQFVFLWVEKW